MSLVVTGTIGIDTVYVPSGEHRENILGGSCAYFAAAASIYGPVSVVAVVGEDFPPAMRQTLAGFANVNLDGLETRPGQRTFRWGGKYMKNMDQRETLYTELGVLEDAPPEIPHALRSAGFVFLANSHPGVQYHLLSQFADPVLAVADTMDLWINIARDELEVLLAHVDGLVLNYDEAELLTGLANPVAAGRKILEAGPRFVVIKKGEHGAILIHEDGLAALPAYPAERVIDPTGAGDTFAAGLMANLASEYKSGRAVDPGSFAAVRRAMAHGTVVASFTIESFSLDRLASLTTGDVNQRFDEYAAMMRLV
ncbi:MAG: bifunctional hydroxymethylpyrimidine kinase/phosphomethylpyrimidine kinase [Phycisphaeraceae bacterium]|nr:bifunctional hydroxymethylpyrimidine kinase/phosphomethylpyrimidine kinase [Phycisphaeraceae bacterium]MCW5762233.1 bifunctional hydroxymethylpyrimidine kinase/phosphomethylpyrimidine kinase [Phycisphaeraceae bacterium]